MADLIDRPLNLPAFPTHARPAVMSPDELEGTPGCLIPTETLDQSPQGRAVNRKRLRLIMAWELFCSLHAGHVTAITGRADKSRAWCWDQADKFFADHDRPTPPPAVPVMSDTIRLSEIDIDTA